MVKSTIFQPIFFIYWCGWGELIDKLDWCSGCKEGFLGRKASCVNVSDGGIGMIRGGMVRVGGGVRVNGGIDNWVWLSNLSELDIFIGGGGGGGNIKSECSFVPVCESLFKSLISLKWASLLFLDLLFRILTLCSPL